MEGLEKGPGIGGQVIGGIGDATTGGEVAAEGVNDPRLQAQATFELGDDAQQAEARVQELEEALEAAVRTIEELEKKLLDAERAQQLERLLIEAGTVDLETAQILAERRLASTEASAHEVVQELVSTKGHLFRSPQRGITGSAVSGGPASATDSLSELAAEARRTGDRRAVLRYLRGRRG